MTELEKAARMALEALEGFIPYLPLNDEEQCCRYDKSITALTAALADNALNKMAENARELGLDYEPSAGTQVSKVWWDGEKLMAQPIPLNQFYKEPEQPAQPVAYLLLKNGKKSSFWFDKDDAYGLDLSEGYEWVDLYTHPQAREPLTDEAIERCMKQAYSTVHGRNLEHAFARAIEAAHGIGEKK